MNQKLMKQDLSFENLKKPDNIHLDTNELNANG